MGRIPKSKDVEKRIRSWADITMLSLESKRAAVKKRYPELRGDEISELIRKELSMLKIKESENTISLFKIY
jgi:hypothetical protein